MVNVRIETAEGLISSLDVRGHARTADHSDTAVCAAVSVLARTAAQTLRDLADVRVDGNAPEPGDLYFSVEYGSDAPVEHARGVCDTVLHGLRSVAAETPQLCGLEIIRKG